MKIIYGFDCALRNFGICCIKFNDNWRNQLQEYNKSLLLLLESNKNIIIELQLLLKDLDNFINNIITIIYMDVIDLANKSNNELTLIDKTKILKGLLCHFDKILPPPDIVLIEYQMKQNDISRAISHQIAYHYIQYKNTSIYKDVSFSINEDNINRGKDNSNRGEDSIVELVGTSLKNAYTLAPNGEYGNFIAKYSNYVANKKHTDFNFKYFLKMFNVEQYKKLLNMTNKTNDIADAFLMCFGWLKKNKMI